MLQDFTKNFVVKLFGMTAKLGVDRLPGFNRAFLALYPLYKQYLEAGPIERLSDFVPNGSLVIDVGANVGFFSLRFAEWVGDTGKVISIEPEQRNYDSLVSALGRAGVLVRVQAVKALAAAEPGTALLELNPLHPADHKMSRDNVGVPVTAVTLDGLVPDRGPSRPALVKIDVQGAEMLVLQGMTEVLEIAKPALFIELYEKGLNSFGASVSAVLNLLAGYGYEAHWLERSGPQKASPSEVHARIARTDYVDVLFLPTAAPP
jgi:FkbM family methyltransferase